MSAASGDPHDSLLQLSGDSKSGELSEVGVDGLGMALHTSSGRRGLKSCAVAATVECCGFCNLGMNNSFVLCHNCR